MPCFHATSHQIKPSFRITREDKDEESFRPKTTEDKKIFPFSLLFILIISLSLFSIFTLHSTAIVFLRKPNLRQACTHVMYKNEKRKKNHEDFMLATKIPKLLEQI